MAESSWPMSEVSREHMQNLVGKGYMTTVAFATYLVPADSASPALMRGYVAVCAAFFERGF
jgi:hypothetical protein